MVTQFQNANRELKVERDKWQNQAREVQRQKDKLENEIVGIKLDQKNLTTEKRKQADEIKKARDEASRIKTERDFYVDKCKKLENGIKLKVEEEIEQLTKAMDVLKEENQLLQAQNMSLEGEVSSLKSTKSKMAAKLSELGAKFDNAVSEPAGRVDTNLPVAKPRTEQRQWFGGQPSAEEV